MKKIAALSLFLISAVAMADSAQRFFSEHVTNTPYAASIKDGVVTVAQAWEGEQIVKFDTGECRKIVHSHLRIVDLGNGLQGANLRDDETTVACPA
jgi:hypothetical protein